MTRSGVTLCWWTSPAPLAGNTGLYLSIPVSAKQSGWPGNPVDYRIWRLTQECVYMVQDACLWHQRLDAAHQWHTGKHITKHRNSWKWRRQLFACVKAKGHHLEHSAKLKPARFKANTLHNRLFSEPPTVYRGNTLFRVLSIAAI